MSLVTTEVASVYINITGPEADSPNPDQVRYDHLKKYEGTCYNNSYVSKILETENKGYIKYIPGTDGMYISEVIMTYEAITVPVGHIIHNARVVMVNVFPDGTIEALCSINDYTSAFCNIDSEGVVDIDMIIPVIADVVTYSQCANTIAVRGSLIHPRYDQNAVGIYYVPKPDKETIEKAKKALESFESYVKSIASKKRAGIFKNWFYPYKISKKIISKKNKNRGCAYDLFTGKEIDKMYVSITDKYPIADLQFEIRKSKSKLAVEVPLDQFIEFICEKARTVWNDIKQLCETYEDDDVYSSHRSIWSYYSKLKKSVE